MRFPRAGILVCLSMVVAWPCGLAGQIIDSSACSIAPPVFVSGAPNIFSDQQEQYLGDAMSEMQEADLRLAAVTEDDQLKRIGTRLLAALPYSEIHYTFRIYDSGELNAFSIGGGRVYISRKLITAAANEDELAGILAHEIGHIATHQDATEYTRAFRIRLGVTQVTDRADVFAKLHQLMSTPPKRSERGDSDRAEEEEEKDQLLADHAGLYALVRAGYAPESFASFFDKIAANKGKTGNALSNFFHTTNEESWRYRTDLKLIAALPAGCKGRAVTANDAFMAWQRRLVNERIQVAATEIEGDKPIKLESPLRPSLWRIRFSPDGRYVLAQDESGINVVDRAAEKVAFRIDAPDVREADFTPDSQQVVFHDDKLRVERWSVVTGKRSSVKEMVIFEGCDQTLLAPDGNSLVCFKVTFRDDYPRLGVRIFDVESGRVLFETKDFYVPDYYGARIMVFELEFQSINGFGLANIAVSQDGRFLVAGAGNKVMAYDFNARQPVALAGKLRSLGQVQMAFVGSDRLYVVGDLKGGGLFKSSILTFPDGRVEKEGQIGNYRVGQISKGANITISPLKDYAIAVVDSDVKPVTASKTNAIDVWDQEVSVEGPAGGLQLGKLAIKGAKLVPLPLGKLPWPQAKEFSADGKYLAASLKDRGEIWDLTTGKMVTLTRPFRSLWMDADDRLIGQFTKYGDKEPKEVRMVLDALHLEDLGKYETDELQYHDLQLRYQPNGKSKSSLRNATLEVRKMGKPDLMWNRSYAHETPALWWAEDNRMVLAWDLSNDTAKSEIKASATLTAELNAFKDKKRGLLLETVVPETGVTLEQVVIPEADLSNGRDDERRAWISGEFVLVRGEHGNTVIYRVKDGTKVGEFFGFRMATDAAAGLIAATNREDEIVLVEEQTAKELRRFSLGSPVRMARIVGGKDAAGKSAGKTLLVLTADQVVHRMAL